MRTSLQNIELVEKYLSGELNDQEKLDFENALQNDAELQQQLVLQKDIMRTVERMAMKKEIEKVAQQNRRNNFWKWVLGIAITLLIASAIFTVIKSNNTSSSENKNASAITETGKQVTPTHSDSATIINENNLSHAVCKQEKANTFIDSKPKEKKDSNGLYSFNGLKSWVQPDVQSFIVDPSKGATIEGKEGTLIIVPTDAFVDENNELVKSKVKIELVEALNLDDMVLYRLGTLSNGQMLESGGMLYLKASSQNKEVKINTERPLYVEIPTYKVKDNMMVFEGNTNSSGHINWENPKQTKKYLVNVPFYQLNFLPNGFAETVEAYMPYKNYKHAKRSMVDSLYYNLTSTMIIAKENQYGIKEKRGFWYRLIHRIPKVDAQKHSLLLDTVNIQACNINPLSIKTIKNKEFSTTFIATAEFEERIKYLHELDNGEAMLQIYVNHLNDNLSFCDSLVAAQLDGDAKIIFQSFANEKLGNTKGSEMYQKQLSDYYAKKRKQYEIEKEKALESLQLNKKLTLEKNDSASIAIINKNLPKRTVGAGQSYGFQWSKPGWVNIDAYLHLLSYGSYTVNINLIGNKERTDVFQWLNTINNLTPLNTIENNASALFPLKNSNAAPLMSNTFCFAISKEGENYYWSEKRYNPYENENITVSLQEESIDKIKERLKYLGANNHVLDWMEQVRIQETRRRKLPMIEVKRKIIVESENEQMRLILTDLLLDAELKKLAFKCYNNNLSNVSENNIISK